jgi:hypothetical protein
VTEDAARRGTRDNGLRCGSYTPLADVDPRVADALLSALREEGIAAYAAPTPAATGGIMEPRLPDSPTDRVWVDEEQLGRARPVVGAHADEPRIAPAAEPDVAAAGQADVDAAWQQVLASLQSTSSSPVPPWPVSEDVDASGTDTRLIRPASLDEDENEDDEEQLASDDEHFVPPPPPPLPRLHRKTVAAIASIVVGLLILATNFEDGTFTVLAVLAILAGLASLVWRMHDGPPTDSGWDDGAVL